jgi:hypothetical protein
MTIPNPMHNLQNEAVNKKLLIRPAYHIQQWKAVYNFLSAVYSIVKTKFSQNRNFFWDILGQM